jgi:hypothetical protein
VSRFAVVTAALGAFALAAFVACADSELDSTVAPGDVDAGSRPSAPDADTEGDAGDDAAVETDAGTPECSKEGYCHTTVPKHQTLRGVWSDGAGATWAVSEEGGVLRYDGKDWKVQTTLSGPLRSIWGSGPTDIWIGGDTGLFHGEGTSSANLAFAAVETPGPQTPILSVWGTGADDVWATGYLISAPNKSRVIHYGKGDGGGTPEWSLETVTTNVIDWKRVFGSQATGVWVVGDWVRPRAGREVLVHRRSAGSTEWKQEVLPTDPDEPSNAFQWLYDASVSTDGASMWLVGKTTGAMQAYAYATSADGGQTFTWTFGGNLATYEDELFNAIGANGTNAVWVAGNYARLRHWNGLKWKQAVVSVTKYPVIAPIYAIGGLPDDLWFVGADFAIHRVPSKIQP